MKKIILILTLLVLSTPAHANIQDFTLIQDFPIQTYGGNTMTAIFSFTLDQNTTIYPTFLLRSAAQFTPNLIELPERSILIDNTILNCTELITPSDFTMTCMSNELAQGTHNISVSLTTAPHIAPDTFDYSLMLSQMTELPILSKPEVIVTHFSTGSGGSSYTPPLILKQKTIYLSHLENISYERYEYHPPEENTSGISLIINDSVMWNITASDVVITDERNWRELFTIMGLLIFVLFLLFQTKINSLVKKKEHHPVNKE